MSLGPSCCKTHESTIYHRIKSNISLKGQHLLFSLKKGEFHKKQLLYIQSDL